MEWEFTEAKNIAKTLQTADTKKPPKCLTAGVLEFLHLVLSQNFLLTLGKKKGQ